MDKGYKYNLIFQQTFIGPLAAISPCDLSDFENGAIMMHGLARLVSGEEV